MNLTIEMLLPLAGILLGAKLAAQVSQRLGLPAVFGELFLGLLIGPSLLGWLDSTEVIHLLADIGVIILMFIAGLETDIKAMRSVGKASVLTALGGVLLPLTGGTAVGLAFGLSLQQALFIGAVLTATSVSISAQTLRELGLFRSRSGMTIMGAAIIDDVLGVLIFALVMSLSGESNLALTLGKMALFFPVAWIAGNYLLPLVLRWEKNFHHREASLAVFFSLLLGYAWAAEELGSVAAITGAYLLGVVFARHIDGRHIIHSGMSSIGYGFFIPIFFVNVGLQAQVTGITQAPLFAGVLAAVAVISKIAGSGAGARLGGLGTKAAAIVGCSMVSRGEVALVLAGAGLTGGLLDASSFAILVFVILFTTLLTPPMLRLVTSAPSLSGVGVSFQRAFAPPAWQDYVLEEPIPVTGTASGD
jgi:Kef-type K+ transport system membrane component KefB